MDSAITYKDIIRKGFLHLQGSGTLSVFDISLTLFITCLMGLFIFYVYRKTFQGVLYTQSFNISLVMLGMITALIIMTVSSNLVLSLGMVGALSIVRFRTAIKDPMDIVFMFWSIAVGIANGAGYFQISIVGSLFIGGMLVLLMKVKLRGAPYLLVLNYLSDAHDSVVEAVRKQGKFTVRTKTVSQNNVELTVELRLRKDNTTFVKDIAGMQDVNNVTLVSHDGDYAS